MKAIYSILYTLSAKGFSFFLNYIAVSLLLLESYGEFSLIFSTINSLVVVTSLGLLYSGSIISSKWMSVNKDYVFNYFKFSLYLIFVLSLLFSYSFSIFYGNFIWVFLSVFIFSLVSLFDGFFYGIGSIKKLSIIGLINIIIIIPITYVFIKNLGLYGSILTIAFCKVFIVVIQIYFFAKEFEKKYFYIKINYFRQIMLFYRKYNLPLLISAFIATPVVTASIYILSINKNLEEVAIFSWIYQIYLIGMFIPISLGSYYLSILNKKNIENKINYIFMINKFNLLVTMFSIFIIFMIKYFILELGKIEKIPNSSNVFNMFLVCMLVYSLNLGFLSFWSSIGKNYFHLVLQILWAFTLLFTVYLSVSELGAVSIPLGMSLGFMLQYVLQFLTLKKHIKKLNVNKVGV